MTTGGFPAFRFDGRDAAAMAVTLRIDGGSLVVETLDGVELDRERLDRASISDPLEHAPRLVSLPNGATLEVHESREFAQHVERAGLAVPTAVQLQRRLPAVILALVLIVVGLAVAYFKALPPAARWVAFSLPAHVEQRMGDQVMIVLDKHYLRPSRLDPARRTRIADRFARAAAASAPGIAYRLEFRTTHGSGINAFALPGGTIILLDGLIKLADDDDAVLGVLGHELGHVVHKHSVREIFQSLAIGGIASLLWGDFSGVAAGVPATIGMLQSSRNFEREADEFAIAFLGAQGLSAQPLHDFFLKMRDHEAQYGADSIPEFLSTHPSTEERLERLRRDSH